MGRHDGTAKGLARRAFRGKLDAFLDWRRDTLCDIMPSISAPERGESLSPTRIRRTADAIIRRLRMAGCAIHVIEDKTADGSRFIGAVLLAAGWRTIDGLREKGTTLTAEAVTFILTPHHTGIIARHLDLDIYQHALERYIGRDALTAPVADAERDQAFFDGIMGAVLVTDLLAVLCGLLAVRAGERGPEMPIAVPLGPDLLLGRVRAVEPVAGDRNQVGSEGMFWEDTGYRHERGRSRRLVDGLDVVMMTEIRTHVPAHRLRPEQERLRDALEDFRRRHSAALLLSFEAAYLFETRDRRGADDEALAAAFSELQDILRSPDWRNSVGGLGR